MSDETHRMTEKDFCKFVLVLLVAGGLFVYFILLNHERSQTQRVQARAQLVQSAIEHGQTVIVIPED